MILFSSSSNQYLQVVSTYTPTSPGSISMWVRPTTVSGTKYIISLASSYQVRQAGSDLSARIYTGTLTTVSSAFTSNTLYHVAITWEETLLGVLVSNTIYINGSVAVSGTALSLSSPGSGNLRVSRINTGAGSYWDGYMEDFRLYNRVLSADEIMSIYINRGFDNIIEGCTDKWLMVTEYAPTVAATGTGAVKNLIGTNNFTPNNSPTYQESSIRLRR